MKILHLASVYPPHIGGVERYVSSLVEKQRSLGHSSEVLTSDIPKNCSFKNGVTRLPVLFNFKRGWGEMPICPTLLPVLRRINCDIVHSHAPSRFFSELSACRKLLTKTPLIITYHLYNTSHGAFEGALCKAHDHLVMRLCLQKADKIIALTEGYRNLIRDLFEVDLKKIEIIPPGVDIALFDPEKYDKEKSAKKFGFAGDDIVLFIGSLIERKGVDYLLRAFATVRKEHQNLSLLIIGEGSVRRELESLSVKLNIDSSTRFLGHVPDEYLPEILASASVVSIPSLSEGLPIVLLEAMSMGKPVVGTRTGGIPDVIRNEQTGVLVEKRNTQALACALNSLLSDKKLAQSMGRCARKAVRQEYSWDVVNRKIMNIYSSTLQRQTK